MKRPKTCPVIRNSSINQTYQTDSFEKDLNKQFSFLHQEGYSIKRLRNIVLALESRRPKMAKSAIRSGLSRNTNPLFVHSGSLSRERFINLDYSKQYPELCTLLLFIMQKSMLDMILEEILQKLDLKLRFTNHLQKPIIKWCHRANNMQLVAGHLVNTSVRGLVE